MPSRSASSAASRSSIRAWRSSIARRNAGLSRSSRMMPLMKSGRATSCSSTRTSAWRIATSGGSRRGRALTASSIAWAKASEVATSTSSLEAW